ncbi:MAG TPA: bifunctional glutamate N-acetyltransferase/amino-acid acetyltransferase ArgJ [Vicinamibacteria bacterium]|nr:bifunctional glutamate N-acetyltransferase/amino-acid acetyltransferase ArgJ [Vicinamibacteria bacterium]
MSTGVTAPRGFRAAAVASGIKPGRLDLALLSADATCAAAGVFTTNLAQAAPVLVAREHLRGGRARAIVVNAGCANAGTGAPGLDDARETAVAAGLALRCPVEEVVVASTGVIGVRLPMEKVRAGIVEASARLSTGGGADAAQAILTTDTRPKEVAVEFRIGSAAALVGGMAKGSGMIAPNMATMLAFFTTDARVETALLQRALREAVGGSLNRITVDGDTSTNDCAVVLASGASPGATIEREGPGFDAFRRALADAASQLARMLVRDGEGVTRTAEVRVEGARTAGEADRIARTVAESPLVKTALHGGDPNWGRILAAVGRAGVRLDPDRVSIWIGDVHVAEGGAARDYEEPLAAAAMREEPARIRIRLGEGDASGWLWTSDLSHGYVDINAHYRS